MKDEFELKLQEGYPFMKQNRVNGERNSYRRFGCECSSGWYNLIHNLCQEITEKYAEYIEYDLIVDQFNKAQLDEIVDIMLECVCSEAETQNIGKDKVPTELVKSRILKLNSMHIEYIFSCLKENPSKVRNIKSYLKTVLYNAAVTIDNYYTSEVNYHFNGGG